MHIGSVIPSTIFSDDLFIETPTKEYFQMNKVFSNLSSPTGGQGAFYA